MDAREWMLNRQSVTEKEWLSLKVGGFGRRAFHYTIQQKIVLDTSRPMTKATITRCDLSARFFCIDATLLCEFESDKI